MPLNLLVWSQLTVGNTRNLLLFMYSLYSILTLDSPRFSFFSSSTPYPAVTIRPLYTRKKTEGIIKADKMNTDPARQGTCDLFWRDAYFSSKPSVSSAWWGVNNSGKVFRTYRTRQDAIFLDLARLVVVLVAVVTMVLFGKEG